MGQKVNPIGLRLGIVKTWSSCWYGGKEYKQYLHEDLRLKKYLKKKMYHAGISKIEIERAAKRIRVNIFAARPGIIIGKKGSEIELLKKDLSRLVKGEIFININEVKRPEADAQLIAENVALQLERRVAFRRAIKRSVGMAMKLGVLGVKVGVAGRLGGAEIARSEWYRDGRVPLHTLRADIDYGFAEANTTYGIIGVKVWVFKGEIMVGKQEQLAAAKAI
ncbi:MAG TPA: 30S ribosomal protein S3 [Proteobacteria bacterium]|nr:30S ribosomal protein S3 [Pseudomonadota bacterium]